MTDKQLAQMADAARERAVRARWYGDIAGAHIAQAEAARLRRELVARVADRHAAR